MRLGDEVNSGLIQPNSTEASQNTRNAITVSVPRTKFSFRFQREATEADTSADAGMRLSSAGVTVMGLLSPPSPCRPVRILHRSAAKYDPAARGNAAEISPPGCAAPASRWR